MASALRGHHGFLQNPRPLPSSVDISARLTNGTPLIALKRDLSFAKQVNYYNSSFNGCYSYLLQSNNPTSYVLIVINAISVTCGAQSTVLPRTETTTIQETTTQEESITHDGTTKQDETPSQDETTTTQDDITSQDETTTTQDGISVHSDLTETTVTIEATTFDDGLTETKATTVASAQSETTTSTTTHSTTTSNPGTTPSDDTSTTSSANPLSAIFSATTTAMLGSEWELAWNVWTPWTSCPSCGDGQQMRLKLCSDDSNSTYCDILLPYTPLKLEIKYGIQWRDCVIPECPTNGFWSSWSDWSECSDTCGGGYEKRARLCLGVSNDGAPCEGDEKENRPCNYHECEDEVAQGTSNINKLREFYLPYEPYKESDSITSNKSIGLMATGLIIAVFAIIFVLDAVTFQKQLKLLCRNIKGARRRRKLKIQVEPRREER
ncbi:hypothetical protein CAPTEDRAFT_201226 [Capitella teleta]|uniref:Uncharacterized protein n=1 Tax=Capitella teleta TaxID=283909 RepID=R7VI74_CAPTE|nr:hypothetical protein CAPTEDRAFT_201226 [Capitella teleta]|eukprot:ELU18309.1 hypothetical protein CAPTEDRAFT_201226 [Capitella teleta]